VEACDVMACVHLFNDTDIGALIVRSYPITRDKVHEPGRGESNRRYGIWGTESVVCFSSLPVTTAGR